MDHTLNRSRRWPKVYWTGPGSKIGGLHTKKEFLDLMLKTYPEHIYRRMRGDRVIPPGKIAKGDINGWMAFVNATWIPV